MTTTMERPMEAVDTVVQMTRVIRAPRAKVYEAWTKAEMLQSWFGGKGNFCPEAKVDARVGGAYVIHSKSETDPKACGGSATGTFTKVVPNELLQFNWVPSWLEGEDSLVTVSLRDVDGGTELTLRHERFAAGSTVGGYEKGWMGSLDKLAEKLEVSE